MQYLSGKHSGDCLTWSINLKGTAHLSTLNFFILEKFSGFIVLVVFFVYAQSSEWYLCDFVKKKMTPSFFI